MNKQHTLEAVRKTLDMIEVRGKDNLDLLLGCILALDRIIAEEKQNTETKIEQTEGGTE